MNKVIFTQHQIEQMKYLLNSITTVGIQNATQISVLAQIIAAGKLEEDKDIEEKGSDE